MTTAPGLGGAGEPRRDARADLFGRADEDAPRRVRREASTRGFAAAAGFVTATIGAAAARHGIAEAKLVSRWPEIVGPRLAAVSRPVKVKHRRGLALGGVLVLAVDGASASEVEHQLPQIVERANACFGYGAIAEATITQAHEIRARPGKRPLPKAAAPADLGVEERRRLDAMTRAVEDDTLRDALARLGANVMARARQRPEKSHGAS